MIRGNLRSSTFHNDHGSTNATAVTSDMHGSVMIIDIDAHKFAEMACPSKLSKVRNKARRISGETDNATVHIHHERVSAINLRTRG
jgi:hypothetical protein